MEKAEPFPTARVLLVDDEESICIGITDLLEALGFKSDYVHSIDEACKFLDKNPDVDILLLDVNLGASMSGDVGIKVIRSKFKYVQIVMLTSHSSLDTGVFCMKQGAFDFMTKPFNEDKFIQLAPKALEKKNLLQLNDLYLGILVHDLKSPINNILISAQSAKSKLKDQISEKETTMFSNIESGVWEINSMVNNILNISKFENGLISPESKKINLVPAVEDALEVFKTMSSMTQKTLSVDYEVKEDFSFHSDPTLFKQVLMNITSNSIRFCPRGGEIKVIFKLNSEGLLEGSVKNSDSYINEDEQKKIFSKFFNSSPGNKSKRNFGLGLTYSKMAVDILGGQIWVRSTKEPQSTTFFFTLATEGK